MPLITPASAKEMAQRSWQIRREREQQLRIAAMPIPLPADDTYSSRRLYRVREQVEKLSVMLEAETDPPSIDRLASAIARLSEIERQLAGRPMPGSLKPTQAKPRSRPVQIEPLSISPPVHHTEGTPEPPLESGTGTGS